MNAFICATPVHVLRAIHMHWVISEYKDDSNIYICDTFAGAEKIAKNLENTRLFKNVYYVKYPKIRRLLAVQLLIRWNKGFIWNAKFHQYQKIIGFNIDNDVINALYRLSKKNINFEYHCVEDAPGLYSFYVPEEFKWYQGKLLFGLEKAYFHMKKWWFSQPELMFPEERMQNKKVKLPPMNPTDNNFMDIVNKVFEYVPDEELYSADVLIMEESLYTDGQMIDNSDYRLYESVRERYPDKKMVVKLHPRTKENRFRGNFKVMESTGIPWEVYLLNQIGNGKKIPLMMSIMCVTMSSDKFLLDMEAPKLVLTPLFYDKVLKRKDGSAIVGPQCTEKFDLLKEQYNNTEQITIIHDEKELFEILDKYLLEE